MLKRNEWVIFNPRWPTTVCLYCTLLQILSWCQQCSKSIMTILCIMWFTHCRGWTYHAWRSYHCSPSREEKHLGTDSPKKSTHCSCTITICCSCNTHAVPEAWSPTAGAHNLWKTTACADVQQTDDVTPCWQCGRMCKHSHAWWLPSKDTQR